MPNKSQILRDLTEDQEAAVTTTEGRIRVVAGAGSGKTRTLVHRYVYLRPSRFIREAHDCDGALYDIIGQFDPELWKGMDRLIQKLDGPAPLTQAFFEEGDTVHHAVFGEGVVKETDPDTGVVTVLFEGFGKRRLDPGCLKRKADEE